MGTSRSRISLILISIGPFLAAVFLSSASYAQSLGEALPMTPGSTLAVTGFGPPHVLVELSPSGQVLGNLAINDPEDLLDSPTGLAILGGTIWVSGSNHVVQVDPVTGLVSDGFSVLTTNGVTALCADGETLLVGAIHPDRVLRYTTTGELLTTLELAGDILLTGLDTDGSSLFATSYRTGHIHVFDQDGSETGIIEVDQFPGNLTGLTLDSRGESLWVATGTGTNDMSEFDLSANLLITFPGNFSVIKGLAAVGGIFADGFESGSTDAWSGVQ